MKKIKKFFEKNWFYIIIILLSVIKQIITTNIPIFAISNGQHDDLMMVNMSENLLTGNWLGEYNQYTLVKGIFFPFFLAFSNYIGISYLNSATLFYTFSCIFFVYAIKDIFNEKYQKIYMVVIFIILLFNPLSFASWTFQRLYRNGMTISQVLLIFGGLFASYLRLDKKIIHLIPWIFVSGLGFVSLCNTREDYIWIYPFVIVVSIVLIVKKCKLLGKSNIKIKINNIILFMMPFIMLIVTNSLISTINYIEYGIYTTNELNNSEFKSAIKSIYSVKNGKNIKYVSVTREKLNKLYEMSPTLNSIKDQVEDRMDAWSKVDRNATDGEVEDGWFFWALRDAVDKAGYYKDAKTANNFYRKVSNEIDEYIKKNNIDTISTMPSALMSPWRDGYSNELLKTSFKIMHYIVTFDEVITTNDTSIDDGSNGISRFERISNEKAYNPNLTFKFKGWIFSKNGDNLRIELVNNENDVIFEIIPSLESEDVYEYYNAKYLNSKNCRFNVSLNVEPNEDLKIFIKDEDTNDSYFLDLDSTEYNISDDIVLNVDIAGKTSNDVIKQSFSQKYVDRLNFITDIYKIINPYLFFIGIICYIYLTLKMIHNFKNKKSEHFSVWLILSSIILSLIILVIGVSYNEISSCASIRYMYLSGSYPLLLMFEIISILYIFNNFVINVIKKWNLKIKSQGEVYEKKCDRK